MKNLSKEHVIILEKMNMALKESDSDNSQDSVLSDEKAQFDKKLKQAIKREK